MPYEQDQYDAIVIGSGIGGLTAAGLLARVANKKVLVLEKHTEPGGLTHVFRRDGASWDVGLHYIGDMGPGTPIRRLFDYLSGGQLQWNRMPDSFEHFVYPGLHFTVPSDPAQYQDRLIETFPDEVKAIRRYFRDIRKAARWAILGFAMGSVPRLVAPVLQLIRKVTEGPAPCTTKDYLESRFRSPQLRALLVSQWGDYGLPPSQSAFAIHALIVQHYLHGAWFPAGGSSRIARTFERGIEQAGGAIRVAQDVLEILVNDGRAVGVRLVDRRGPTPVERTLYSPIVISNVGATITFQKLLSTRGEVGAATAAVRGEIERIGRGLSAVTLYLRLKHDIRTIGIHGENYWINTSLDHDDIDGQTRDMLGGIPRSIFVSFPSIKAGDERFHTAEIIANIRPEAFDAWRGQPKGNRGADYSNLKSRIAQGMLRLAETEIPGLTDLVHYAELSTPLSVEHYTSHPRGSFYGLPANTARFRSTLLGQRMPIDNLYLSGQDAGCLGITGAMMGGVGAASQALGARGYPMIQKALRQGRAELADSSLLPDEKRHAVLVEKQRITPTIWHVEFRIDGAVPEYAPGQFARLHVGDGEWRDYSIAGFDGDRVRFLISTRTGGEGSRFIETAEPGIKTEIELPLGSYTLSRNTRRKVFVATGTGIAPFLQMFIQLQRGRSLDDATLMFGCRTLAEDLTSRLVPLPGHITLCVSREPAPVGGVHGRVTDGLETFDFDPESTEFYLCGSSSMVADCKALLERRGAKHLLIESY